MSKKTVLIITDGIGHNSSCNFNAFCNAKKPTYDYLFSNVPYSLIHTYGEYVGLPDNQMGNSEVGHMTIGSGRVLYQDLVKIHLAIKNDTLKDNVIVKNTIEKSNNIHLIGLASDGGVHSHIDHIIALAKIAQNKNKKVWLHLITDGRDVAPDCAKIYIEKVINICNENIKIATIGGRYYGMDRDNRWDRVELAYNAIANATPKTKDNILDFIDNSYKNEIFDEFLIPTALDGYDGIKDGDGVIFCNFRSDRARELSSVFAKNDFKEFEKKTLNVQIASMTQYDKNIPIPVIFEKDNPTNTLAQVISDAGLSQLHTAETEKYAHVTFFFNGGVEEPFLNETRVLIPSPNVATYDLQPQMSAPKVGEAVRTAMKNQTDFIVVNFANGDMVGHTGVYEAAIKAVEAVDYELGLILEEAKKENYNIVLTSDHGNCEMMKDENGNTLTNHTVGDVYCFVIAPNITKVKEGSLNNIAPTVLKLMGLDIPEEMDEPLI
ncbi:2,3-bisphosphoglycerate-independent phosphoglycerate mutase [Arcobacter cryaerophilus gv. pseudocryaerophilus]|uniref:2,3-bisphosphoglycerate-independent phosphoglycerate mutase n=3 Tax=unclassified Arcobacter TaxID=2593671 RepID=A0AA96L715_9BACT|nr:2,3-bisphosphoglycerate-independent phosphoglycerate mutase [Arcobacter sp. AZ-2023]WPD06352.1 2,3-bisphosphoglycerate-independent phosphoglycerate mutase [Arcobacter sp. DSM 115956]WPD08443.1 2,3-bisphosphoglycerate-independent phosphoglycerate mutase [Arcobacter sp. DSM 115955]WNL32708.1 2,3-bisphosphoglycerate-independent phosphoglycerate mutase [Arcobacter sp. AZ-2023]WNP38858.1 2,3-bisphosphoglycerate-independent phosphoglycerate mutase [Arcobacter sp. AZ-2023]